MNFVLHSLIFLPYIKGMATPYFSKFKSAPKFAAPVPVTCKLPTPSVYTQAVLDWSINSNSHAIVNAVAGSGKSTLLLSLAKQSAGTGMVLSFGNKISKEMQGKLTYLGILNFKSSTFHSAGKGIVERGSRFMKPESFKVNECFKSLYSHIKGAEFVESFIVRLVSLAKDSAFGVTDCPAIREPQAWKDLIFHHALTLDSEDIMEDEAISMAMSTLEENNRVRHVIDFGDMIYFPILFNLEFPKIAWLFVDEAQDLNVARQIFAARYIEAGARALFVGDPMQAIMGFSGADVDSMENIKTRFDCAEFPLSVCYRCDQSIVEIAASIVPQIKAREGAGEGEVSTVTFDELTSDIPSYGFSETDGIICRNNAPLVPLAYRLIRHGVICKIEGKNSIGADLIRITYKWKDNGINKFIERFEQYIQKEIIKAEESKKLPRVGMLEDQLDCMRAFVDRCRDLGITQVVSKEKGDTASLQGVINDLFCNLESGEEKKTLILSSIHKSKGLEFDRCFVLGKDQYMPSKYAIRDWQLVQEKCLEYVAVTRAKTALVWVTDIPARKQ